jgi:hypothetical protein
MVFPDKTRVSMRRNISSPLGRAAKAACMDALGGGVLPGDRVNTELLNLGKT